MSRGSSPTTSGSNDLRMAVRPGAKKHSPSPRRPSSVSRRTKVQSKFPSTTAVFRRVIFNGLAFLNRFRCRRLDTPTHGERSETLYRRSSQLVEMAFGRNEADEITLNSELGG